MYFPNVTFALMPYLLVAICVLGDADASASDETVKQKHKHLKFY